jgi:hypothetical protein
MSNVNDLQSGLSIVLGSLNGIIDSAKDKMTPEQKKIFDEQMGDIDGIKKKMNEEFKKLQELTKDGSFGNFGKI